jgi:hypothetical protein
MENGAADTENSIMIPQKVKIEGRHSGLHLESQSRRIA